jgi:HlyD family secretion protein
MKKIKHFIKTKKILSIIIIIIVILVGYWIYNKSTSTAGQTSYVFSKAQIKDIVTTVTGTGQISAQNQIDIKSKASGDLVYLNTKANGTEVKKGTLIAQIDTRDAIISLENAKISYAKLVKSADAPTLLQAQTSLSDAILNNKKSYDDAFNAISSSFVDLPAIVSGLNDLLYGRNGYLQTESVRTAGDTALTLQNKAGISFDRTKTEYESLLNEYKNISRTSSTSTIESFVNSTYIFLKDMAESIKNAQNAVDYVRKQKNDTSGDTSATNIASWTSTINSNLSNVLSSKTAIGTTYQNINQKTLDLIKLQNGADELDIESQRLSLQQAQNTYENYFVRAPFDGVLARLSVKSTDTVSSGTVIGTLVSSQKIANITLNEVDVSKVHVGQKVKLTFDAIDKFVIDGTVTTVDLVGTVTQGVVNYNVEITLDGQDDRIKSGMSVSAEIITETKESVLTVPNSAIKTQGNNTYVEVFNISSTTAPTQKKVITGISNDTLTEIVSGINEGDRVVTRTISGTNATAVSTPSLFGSGQRTTGTNAVRIPRN